MLICYSTFIKSTVNFLNALLIEVHKKQNNKRTWTSWITTQPASPVFSSCPQNKLVSSLACWITTARRPAWAPPSHSADVQSSIPRTHVRFCIPWMYACLLQGISQRGLIDGISWQFSMKANRSDRQTFIFTQITQMVLTTLVGRNLQLS